MLIFIVLVASILTLLLYPLFQQDGLDLIYLDYVVDERKQLKYKKANVVLIIKELDFDYETGKLSKTDYKNLRDKYEAQAVSIMQELEHAEDEWQKHLKKVEQNIQQAKVKYDA
ncbi:MAG TPA: hypothetical protein PKC21_09825 [Oligoflexia bacterium]|nr:hypothetical protein [Oligoflexia bacterium]HMR25637.1 hypothetical protein [Oligoflexia bacterium]